MGVVGWGDRKRSGGREGTKEKAGGRRAGGGSGGGGGGVGVRGNGWVASKGGGGWEGGVWREWGEVRGVKELRDGRWSGG